MDQYINSTWHLDNALLAFILYEHLITIQQESLLVWRRAWSMSTWIFIANRYLLATSAVVQATAIHSQYRAIGMLSYVLTLSKYLVLALFSALRVYALRDRNIFLAFVVFVLMSVPFATNTFQYSHDSTVYGADLTFSTKPPKISPSVNLWLAVGTRFAVIIAEVLVLAVTWMKTYRTYREAMLINMEATLSGLLLRDGTIYFIVLLLLNIAQIILKTQPELYKLSSMNDVINTLSPILISRFLLNLRQTSQARGEPGFSELSILHFRLPTFVGNMGEELDHSPRRGDNLSDTEDALCIFTQDNVDSVCEEPLDVSIEALEKYIVPSGTPISYRV